MLEARWLPHAAGSLVDGDGCMVARAARDLAPGDAVTINYCAAELDLGWGVAVAASC